MVTGDFGAGFERVFWDPGLVLLLVTAGLLTFHLGETGAWRVMAATVFGMLLGVLAAHLEVRMPYALWVPLIAVALIALGIAANLRPPIWPALAAIFVPSVYVGRAFLGLGEFGVLTWLGFAAGVTVVMAAALGVAHLVTSAGTRGAVRIGAAVVAALSIYVLVNLLALDGAFA